MIHVIIVNNPFDRRQRKDYYESCSGKTVKEYHSEEGEKVYAINGVPCGADYIPVDGEELVVMPKIEGKALGWILSIGITVLSAGIGAGIIGGMTSMWARMGLSLAIGMVGNALVNKLTPTPKADLSNTEQSNTYGWGAPTTLTGQGYPLPIVYGTVKTSGIMLARHVVSEGEKQYLNILYCVAEGPIDEISNIELNGNPISNYADVQVDIRLGANTQKIIPNFNDSYADTGLAYELNDDSNWHTHKLDGNTAQGLELTFSFPAGLYYSNDSGGTSETWIDLEAQYRKVGDADWKNIDVGRIKKNTNKSFYLVYAVRDLEPARYEVRARCTKKAGTSIRYANKVQWQGVTQVIYDDFEYPGKALIGIKALATDQLSGNDPSMTCLVTRKNVNVWNPATKHYEERPADNPAWATYDILHHCLKIDDTEGGFEYEADGVRKENIDYYAFKAWAAACANAGMAFNYLYDSAMSVWDAKDYPCRVGRGAILLMGTKFSCVYDYAGTPVQLFTVANMKKDSFKEEFQARDQRANAVEISFLNKDKNYERDVLTVYGDDYDTAERNIQPVQIELMGCTSLKQAYAFGRYKLRSNKYEIRTVSFDAFVDAIACTIGDVILVQTDNTTWGAGGRILSVNGKELTLDQPIDVDYSSIFVRDQDTDKIYETAITSIDGSKVTVSDATGFSADAVYAAGKTGKIAKMFKVLAIEKGMDDATRTITGIEYYPELYSPDTSKVPEITAYDNIVNGPTDLTVTCTVKTGYGAGTDCSVHCTWINPKTANTVYLETKEDGAGVWVHRGRFENSENSYTFEADGTKKYTVRVYAENELGKRSDYSTARVDLSAWLHPAETPKNIKAYTRYRTLPNGSHRYDILVSWESKDLIGRVWYKTNHVQGEAIVIEDGLSADELGFAGAWVYAGQGKGQLIIPQALPGDTYRIAVTTADGRGVFNLPDNAPKIDKLVALKSTIPNTPDNFKMVIGSVAHLSWNPVTNADVQFYELRTNSNAGGDSDALLARTDGLSFDVTLTKRKGTLYLFACNTEGKYSAPATISYNKPAPLAPPKPDLISSIGGFSVVANPIPADCAGMAVYIDPAGASITRVTTQNSVYSYSCPENVYEVSVAYYDMFGEGARSPSNMVTVKLVIDESMLKDGAISLKKVDESIKKALEAGKVSHESVNQIVSNLNKEDGYKTYSALTQLNNAIELRVKDNEIINRINLTPKGTTIDGSYLHITGKTTIDNNVIVNGMLAANAVTSDKIAAGAVTANKISVNSLEAVSANVGNLTGGTISGTTLIGSTIRNQSGSFSVDPDGNIRGATLTAGTIDGNSVRINGYNVRAVSILKGTGKGDFTIPLPEGYEEKDCVWTAFLMSNARSTYSFSMNGRRVHAKEISGDYPDPLCGYMVIGIK